MINIQTRKKSFLVLAAIFLFVFVIIALLTSRTSGFVMDEWIAYRADAISNGILLTMMKLASVLGSSEMILIVTVIIGFAFLIKRKWRLFFFFFTLSVGGVFLNFVAKTFIKRARPGDEVSYIEAFNVQLEIQSYSFPSGHTMRATILFLFLIYLSFRYVQRDAIKYISSIIYIGLLVAIALSRIVLDAHYATDVIGGLFFSIFWFYFCLYFFDKEKEVSFSRYRYRYRQ